jgi:hypothetical protein
VPGVTNACDLDKYNGDAVSLNNWTNPRLDGGTIADSGSSGQDAGRAVDSGSVPDSGSSGAPDSGSSRDAGLTAQPDAGSTTQPDAGSTTQPDAGSTSSQDAGTGTPNKCSGCCCTAGLGLAPGDWPWLLLGLLLSRRRFRRPDMGIAPRRCASSAGKV